MKNIRTGLSLLLICFLGLIILIYISPAQSAQSAGDDTEQDAIKYKPTVKFVSGISSIVKLSESSVIERVLSDNTKQIFKRDYDYFITIFAPGDDGSGFVPVLISLDSLIYHFDDGKARVDYNSQSENAGLSDFPDLTYIVSSIGKTFKMTYSPYGEIASIEGYDLDEQREYFSRVMPQMDSLNSYIWREGAGDNRFKFLSDMKKFRMPTGYISPDSIWQSPVMFQTEGLTFLDTIGVKVDRFVNGSYFIYAKTNSPKNITSGVLIYGSNQPAVLDSVSTVGEFKLELSPKGSIKQTEIILKTSINARIVREVIKETVNTRQTWKLLNQFKKQY